jgi:Icc protein
MLDVAQISDCHLFPNTDQTQFGINPYKNLETILALIKAKKPDLLLVTGDLSADESQASYAHFQQLWSTRGRFCPLKIIPGNHDDWSMLKHVVGAEIDLIEQPYCNDNWMLHGLNSQVIGSGEGWVDLQEIHRLCEIMQQQSGVNHLIALHHHPVEVQGWANKYQWTNRQECLALLKTAPNLKAILFGHLHENVEQEYEQTLLLGCPSTCWQFIHADEFAIDESLTAGFRWLTLHNDGQIDNQVIRID